MDQSHWEKRPKIWGGGDIKHKLSTSYERAFRSSYSGNYVYLGFADVGSLEDQPVWQISRNTYNSSGQLISVEWAINAQGIPSALYQFSWSQLNHLQFG